MQPDISSPTNLGAAPQHFHQRYPSPTPPPASTHQTAGGKKGDSRHNSQPTANSKGNNCTAISGSQQPNGPPSPLHQTTNASTTNKKQQAWHPTGHQQSSPYPRAPNIYRNTRGMVHARVG